MRGETLCYNTGRHYFSQTDIEVDISSPYSLKTYVFTTKPVHFNPVQVSNILYERRNRNGVGSLRASPFQ